MFYVIPGVMDTQLVFKLAGSEPNSKYLSTIFLFHSEPFLSAGGKCENKNLPHLGTLGGARLGLEGTVGGGPL